MDGLLEALPKDTGLYTSTSLAGISSKQSDSLVIDALSSSNGDAVTVDLSGIYGSLSETLESVTAKLEKILTDSGVGGLDDVSPEFAEPDFAAASIMTGIEALYSKYKAAADESGDTGQLDAFMAAAKEGIERGFNQAYATLDDIGAFEIPGLKESILTTKDLLFDHLSSFKEALDVPAEVESTEQSVAQNETTPNNETQKQEDGSLSIDA